MSTSLLGVKTALTVVQAKNSHPTVQRVYLFLPGYSPHVAEVISQIWISTSCQQSLHSSGKKVSRTVVKENSGKVNCSSTAGGASGAILPEMPKTGLGTLELRCCIWPHKWDFNTHVISVQSTGEGCLQREGVFSAHRQVLFPAGTSHNKVSLKSSQSVRLPKKRPALSFKRSHSTFRFMTAT